MLKITHKEQQYARVCRWLLFVRAVERWSLLLALISAAPLILVQDRKNLVEAVFWVWMMFTTTALAADFVRGYLAHIADVLHEGICATKPQT